ncbi:penicillin-binding protein 1C [Kaarinaea lacus]
MSLPQRTRQWILVLSGLLLLALLILIVLASLRSSIQSPTPSYLLHDRHGEFLAELESADHHGYGYWPLPNLPDRVVKATLALEDKRFWSHPGVDVIAIGRALWQNLTHQQRISGASTLAMQLVRLQRPAPRTYINKIIEAMAAVIMTVRYDRDTVLKNYLRWVPYGNRIHGIRYAARRYLDKPVEDLSWAEIAFLAAIPQSPSRMNPYTAVGRYRAIQRGRRLLQGLQAQQVLTHDELELALAEIHNIEMPIREDRPAEAMHAILQLQQQLAQAKVKNQYLQQPLIKTSIDLGLQQTMLKTAQPLIKNWRHKGAGNLSLIILNRQSNLVLTWLGSADYFDGAYNGAIDFAQIKRSSGSTLKPFIYALALERGNINANTVLDDLPMAGFPVRNSDYRYLGPLLPRQALSNSRNIPAVTLLNKVGLDNTYGLFRELALHQSAMPASYFGQGLALGSLHVRLQDLVRAYSVLANDGRYRDLQWFFDDNDDQQFDQQGKQVMSAAIARLITLFLSDPVARLPTFSRMGTTEYAFPVALKTGTSQGYRDAWTVAYTKKYIVAAWVGNASPQPMYKLGGAGSAAVLVQQVLLQLHNDQRQGLADLNFPIPEDYVAVDLCATSGKLASAACAVSYQEWLPANKIPNEVDNTYTRVDIDARSGLPASPDTPVEFIRKQTQVNFPAHYADWLVQNQMLSSTAASHMAAAQPSQALPSALSVNVEINYPKTGTYLLRNPEAPEASSVALKVIVEPPVKQIVWYVDNEPYQIVEYPYSARLPLTPGRHVLHARVPMTPERSKEVEIFVE